MILPSLVAFQLACAIAAPIDFPAQWNGPVKNEDRYVTTVPFTYVIGYHDWLSEAGDPADALSHTSIHSLRESPPDLLHINQPVPMNHMLVLSEDFFGLKYWESKFISEEDYRKKVEDTKNYVQRLREYGVELVIPYINSCIMLGDHELRTGFWEMYDGWDKLAWLNLGPKPARDPILWCGVPRRSLDPWKPYPEYPYWRYEPSAGDPDWQHFLVRCMEELASCGYDGSFVDDCIMESYAQVDQEQFLQYIASRPSGTIMRKPISLGKPGEGLKYAETIRYWQDSVSELLEHLRTAGRKYKKDFFVLPNWGSISRPIGLAGRENSGKSLESWSRVSRLVMLEESYGPGQIVPGAIHDYALQYKQCLALGVQPALLPYLRGHYPATLAYAETAAGGGGALVEPVAGLEDLRSAYRALYHDHTDLFAGLRPWSQVALLYDTDEVHYEHTAHIYDAMRVARALLDNHIQFDVILKKDLIATGLHRYDTVVLPNVTRLSNVACDQLKKYTETGGRLLATGDIATHDEFNRERPRHAWGLTPWIVRGMTENDQALGSGRITYVRDTARLIPATSIDVEMLSDVLEDIDNTIKNLQNQSVPIDNYVHPSWAAFTQRYSKNYLSTDVPPEVRIHVYQRDDGLLTIHLVYYCVSPWEPDESDPPTPLAKCAVELTLGKSLKPDAAYGLDAFNGRTPVKTSLKNSRATFELEDLGYHRMIVVE
ncbi:MAG: hypothetical protein ABIH23_13900 [bacterium]